MDLVGFGVPEELWFCAESPSIKDQQGQVTLWKRNQNAEVNVTSAPPYW